MPEPRPAPVVESIHQHWHAPQAYWARLRAESPVSQSDTPGTGGRPLFFVARWEDVDAVLRDPETYSSAINGEGTGKFMGANILSMDGGEHRAHRHILAHAFRPSQLARWEEGLMRPVMDRLCDAVTAQGKAELIGEVICHYPVLVICALAGIPAADSPRFLQWALDIHRGMMEPEVGMAASRAMEAYFAPIVAARRAAPGDDLISDIVTADCEGRKLSNAEVFGFLRLLLPAGSESTFRTLASAVMAVLTVPGLKARLAADRAKFPLLIEETIRWDVANTLTNRVTTRDTVLGGCRIPAGASVMAMTCSANRDERRFEGPERFDIDRPSIRHIGFGAGPHQCLGLNLARLELRVGAETLLERLPGLRLDPAMPGPQMGGFGFRGPDALHVLFDSPGDSLLAVPI